MTRNLVDSNGAALLSGATYQVETDAPQQLEARWDLAPLAGEVYEARLVLANVSDADITVSRMDAFSARLTPGDWQARWFTSAWGQEFTPHERALGEGIDLSTRSGRSSNGTHPWLALERAGSAVIVTPAWSGNWHITVENGMLTAGISPWRFSTTLHAGDELVAPSVVIASGATLGEAAASLATAVGAGWIPRSKASDSMRVEWNHWWPYEDAEVNEAVIAANSSIAAGLDIRQVTLDAGWFGPAEERVWEDVRGDWDRVNTDRFPHGLAELGRRIRADGALPGIWIEAEAIGPKADVRRSHPGIVATSDSPARDAGDTWSFPPRDREDPGFLGYVCLGSADGRTFVADALDAAVASIGAEWVKLDFNLDPGAGCTRTDHGHGAADGLYRHYLGLYDVLDSFRERHPDVVLEACSSGGLRIDLGLAQHVHCSFLSDPDYTEHHLQVLWGAALMLPPSAMLHWSWSQWRGDHVPSQLDFTALSANDFDTTLRAAMLQRFGVSLRLPELRPDLIERLALHVRLYADVMAPILRDGTIIPLTGQPLRDRKGERTPSFRVSSGDRHIVATFVLPGGTRPHQVDSGLEPDRSYRAFDLCNDVELEYSNGLIQLPPTGESTSWLVLVE